MRMRSSINDWERQRGMNCKSLAPVVYDDRCFLHESDSWTCVSASSTNSAGSESSESTATRRVQVRCWRWMLRPAEKWNFKIDHEQNLRNKIVLVDFNKPCRSLDYAAPFQRNSFQIQHTSSQCFFKVFWGTKTVSQIPPTVSHNIVTWDHINGERSLKFLQAVS